MRDGPPTDPAAIDDGDQRPSGGRRRWRIVAAGVGLLLVLTGAALAVRLALPGASVLVGAGDITGCRSAGAPATAELMEHIPGTVFAAGDLVYPNGTLEELTECFGPAWGRFRDRLISVPGNKEYRVPGAAGYRAYLGLAPSDPTWSARDVGPWRVYLLDSNCNVVDCEPDSEQVAWLRADLAANPRTCVASIWHHPRFTSGVHGDSGRVSPFWEVLYAAGAELVIHGHDHHYERFGPLDPAGSPDVAHGIRAFIVGTGGIGGTPLETAHAGSEAAHTGTHGVLKLSLSETGYDWAFLPVAGGSFTDSGTGTCHDPPTG